MMTGGPGMVLDGQHQAPPRPATPVGRGDGHLIEVESVVDDPDEGEPDHAVVVDRHQEAPSPLGASEHDDLRQGPLGDQRHPQLVEELTCLHLHLREGAHLVRARPDGWSARASSCHPITAARSSCSGQGETACGAAYACERGAMTSFVAHTTVDCHHAYELSEWWKQVLGYVDVEGDPNEPGHEECMVVDPGTGHAILFIEVPDAELPAKRVHFDLRPRTGTRDEEIERVRALGAVQLDDQRGRARARHRVGGLRRPGGQPVLRAALAGRDRRGRGHGHLRDQKTLVS